MTRMPVRWGILGAGAIARRFAQDMQHSRTGTLVAVASRSLAKAEQFAAAFRDVRAFDDYSTLANWDRVDAVYVATPNSLHAAHSLIAIAAGKAVLCEKPFADSVARARDVADAAAGAGVFCMEAMWTRFLPAMAALRGKIEAGVFGRPIHLDISLGFPRTELPGDPITDPALGGGVVPDLAVYGLSLAEDLLGPFQMSGCEVAWSDGGASRSAVMVLRHAGDGLSVISVSHDTQMANTLVLSGTSARATLEAPFIQARCLRIARVAWATPGVAPSALKMWLLQSRLGPLVRRSRALTRGQEVVSSEFAGSGLQFEIDEVGRCLAAGLTESPRIPMATTLSIMQVLDDLKARSA